MAQKSTKLKLEKIDKRTKKVFTANEVGNMLKNINGNFIRIDKNFTRIDENFKRIDGNIDRLIDGQLKLDQKIDKLDKKLSGKIDALDERLVSVERKIGSLEHRIDSIENKMDSMENRMNSMEYEMKSGFKTIVDFMSAIDLEAAELKKKLAVKVDKNEYIVIEQRVTNLEFQVNDCKKMIDAAEKS